MCCGGISLKKRFLSFRAEGWWICSFLMSRSISNSIPQPTFIPQILSVKHSYLHVHCLWWRKIMKEERKGKEVPKKDLMTIPWIYQRGRFTNDFSTRKLFVHLKLWGGLSKKIEIVSGWRIACQTVHLRRLLIICFCFLSQQTTMDRICGRLLLIMMITLLLLHSLTLSTLSTARCRGFKIQPNFMLLSSKWYLRLPSWILIGCRRLECYPVGVDRPVALGYRQTGKKSRWMDDEY